MSKTLAATLNDLAANNIYTARRRDKYGRTVTHFDVLCRTVVVVVTLPNRLGYLVNEWDSPQRGEAAVTRFDNRADAMRFAAAKADVYGTARLEQWKASRTA